MQLRRQLRELASQALNALVASDVPYFQQAVLQLLLPLATHASLEVTRCQIVPVGGWFDMQQPFMTWA